MRARMGNTIYVVLCEAESVRKVELLQHLPFGKIRGFEGIYSLLEDYGLNVVSYTDFINK